VPGAALRADPHRPLITYCDDATGERTAVSAAELGEWAARTANLLVDGCGLGHGSRIAVLLPPHWQTAAVVLGAWSAGMVVDFCLAATAGLPRIGRASDGPIDAVLVSAARNNDMIERVPPAPVRFLLGLGPGATPLPEVPDDFRDYIAEVRGYSAAGLPWPPVRPWDAMSVDGTSYREWGNLARGLADLRDIRPVDRVLVDTAEREHPVWWLLAPLVVGASVVLCANLAPGDVADRARAEGATRIL
jgi:uncharacterized protein (TIGR03089 family)